MAWVWEIGTDVAEIHALLCASDAHTATIEAPAPTRNIETTRRRVQEGSIHVLRYQNKAIAMFTLTWSPPFDQDLAIFPASRKPSYISRLAINPEHMVQDSMAGAQCLRRAIEVAKSAGADAIRSEANPDLARVRTLLTLFGFEEYGRTQSEDGRRRVYLQKTVGS